MKKPAPTIRLCGLPIGGYPRGYMTTLSTHGTLESALRWGRVSGLASWPDGHRDGRLWIDKVGQPATRESA